MVLVALDCDGTLDCSGGPIPVERVLGLDAIVVVVSPSGACASLPFPKFVDGQTRGENLRKAKQAYNQKLNIYVSDNPGDDQVAAQEGFTYIHPKDFR